MVPGRFLKSAMTVSGPFELNTHGPALLTFAAQAVRYAVDRGEPLPVDLSAHPTPLRTPGASFVTLKKSGKLRGCIGSLEVSEPLAVNVANNAHGAVARDSRFPTVIRSELEDLDVSISVLSRVSPLTFSDEDDLLTQLRPGVDGLVITDHGRRSTFLPQVWEDLPDPADFLNNLKRKGGFDQDQASNSMKAGRYTVTDIGPIGVEKG